MFERYIQTITGLHNLDGVRGNLGVSESEYVATRKLHEAQALTQVIYINVKNIVE
jgi:hypothetical protein